jgi:hypothetical protein
MDFVHGAHVPTYRLWSDGTVAVTWVISTRCLGEGDSTANVDPPSRGRSHPPPATSRFQSRSLSYCRPVPQRVALPRRSSARIRSETANEPSTKAKRNPTQAQGKAACPDLDWPMWVCRDWPRAMPLGPLRSKQWIARIRSSTN